MKKLILLIVLPLSLMGQNIVTSTEVLVSKNQNSVIQSLLYGKNLKLGAFAGLDLFRSKVSIPVGISARYELKNIFLLGRFGQNILGNRGGFVSLGVGYKFQFDNDNFFISAGAAYRVILPSENMFQPYVSFGVEF